MSSSSSLPFPFAILLEEFVVFLVSADPEPHNCIRLLALWLNGLCLIAEVGLVRFLGHLFEHAQAIRIREQRIPLTIRLDHLLDTRRYRRLLLLRLSRCRVEGFAQFINHLMVPHLATRGDILLGSTITCVTAPRMSNWLVCTHSTDIVPPAPIERPARMKEPLATHVYWC